MNGFTAYRALAVELWPYTAARRRVWHGSGQSALHLQRQRVDELDSQAHSSLSVSRLRAKSAEPHRALAAELWP